MSRKIDTRMVGQTIKALRMAHNLTQENVADIVGYSVRNVRRIENNGTSSIDVVNAFAGAFNVSALDILDGCSFFITNKRLLRNRYWRPSPYNAYPNLLFAHMQSRLS